MNHAGCDAEGGERTRATRHQAAAPGEYGFDGSPPYSRAVSSRSSALLPVDVGIKQQQGVSTDTHLPDAGDDLPRTRADLDNQRLTIRSAGWIGNSWLSTSR
jgi:hypothetical protein